MLYTYSLPLRSLRRSGAPTLRRSVMGGRLLALLGLRGAESLQVRVCVVACPAVVSRRAVSNTVGHPREGMGEGV